MLISWISLFLAIASILNSNVKSTIDPELDLAIQSLLSLSKAEEKMFQKVATNKESLLFEDLIEEVSERFFFAKEYGKICALCFLGSQSTKIVTDPGIYSGRKRAFTFFAK